MDCKFTRPQSVIGVLKCLLVFCLFASGALLRAQAEFVDWSPPRFAITGVTLIDGTGTIPLPNQTIIVAEGRIERVGPTDSLSLPSGLPRIIGSGHTLIPGIVGVHNHLHMPGRTFLGPAAARLSLAAGVTTMMTCGAADPDRERQLAEQIGSGSVSGPEIILSAPYVTGPEGSAVMVNAGAEKPLRDTIRYWADRGVRWFKVYRHTRPEDLAIVVDEAHRLGARVTGHLCATTLAEAARLGIDGVEHGLNAASDFRIGKTPGRCDGDHGYMDHLDLSADTVTTVLQTLVDAGTTLTSTLSIYEASVAGRYPPTPRILEAMTPSYRSRYGHAPPAVVDTLRLHRLRRIMAFERRFVELGGLLAAGPDPGRYNLPGYGDQRNFELLREAGFSTEATVRILTANGARVLGRDDIGMVKAGMRADLVLLEGDLAADPAVINAVSRVFRAGIGYDVQRLIRSVAGQIGPEN